MQIIIIVIMAERSLTPDGDGGASPKPEVKKDGITAIKRIRIVNYLY